MVRAVLGNDAQSKTTLEALEKFASNIIAHRGTRKKDDRDFDPMLNPWGIYQRL